MEAGDVTIIGAGPAGIMAAITASSNGRRVLLIDRNQQIGRKLLSTGNGRCNLANANLSIDHYHGASPDFVESVLKRFDQNAVVSFFQSLGLLLKEEEQGRIFPRTNQAASVVEVLLRRLQAGGVELALGAQVKSVQYSGGWKVDLIDGGNIAADDLIIATGGRAAHQLGSTGDGLFWARKLGHSLTPIHAALVAIETVQKWPGDLAGIKVQAKVRAVSGGREIGGSQGDLLFTTYGVSGPSVMALAGSVAKFLEIGEVELHIDMFADMSRQELDAVFERATAETPSGALVGLLPMPMIETVCRLAELNGSERLKGLSDNQRSRLIDTLTDLTPTVSKLRPFKEAQVTSGGVDCDEIDPATMKSKLVDHLYFAGEVVDVDGDSGGYNLQWAWSSGHVAGGLGRKI